MSPFIYDNGAIQSARGMPNGDFGIFLFIFNGLKMAYSAFRVPSDSAVD
jgi:hypothetical protein